MRSCSWARRGSSASRWHGTLGSARMRRTRKRGRRPPQRPVTARPTPITQKKIIKQECVAADRTYSNNEYIPGVGYYHAPYHAWFPHPYNYHDPARGYFAGGLWQALPWALAFSQSRPDNTAVAAALAAQRARLQREQQQQQQSQPSRSSGFWGRTFGGSHFSSSRPTSTPHTPSAPSHSIIRGGFGGSSHPAGS